MDFFKKLFQKLIRTIRRRHKILNDIKRILLAILSEIQTPDQDTQILFEEIRKMNREITEFIEIQKIMIDVIVKYFKVETKIAEEEATKEPELPTEDDKRF